MLLSIFCCCVPIYNSLFARRSGSNNTGRGLFSFTRRLKSQTSAKTFGSASSEGSRVRSHSQFHSHNRKSTSSSGLKPKFSHSTVGSSGDGRKDSGLHDGGAGGSYGVSVGGGMAGMYPHEETKWEWLGLPGEAGFGDMTVSALISAEEGHGDGTRSGCGVSSQRRQSGGGPHILSDPTQAGSGPRGTPMKTVVAHQRVEIV